jgi:Acetyltransferase (GNAT) domain
MLSVTLAGWETKVLSVDDPSEFADWDGLVDRAPIPDVYYRPGYARANEAVDHGKAITLLLVGRNIQVLVPLLLRPLSDLPFAAGQPGFDAVTPYGYGGLLSLCERGQPSESDVPALLDALQHWCNEWDVISCHIRLHPLLDQTQWLDARRFQDHAASICFRALTTGIDLAKWDSTEQRITGVSATRRLRLNRARRHLRVLWSGSEIPMAEALKLFRQVYEIRMTQLNVIPYYHFSEEYYTALGERTNLAVALAWFGDEVVGGHLFLADREFVHYHLGAANENGLKFNACTLLINAGARWARERGCKLLHLGGGGHGVFGYKTSYGGPVYRYHSLDMIADEPRYRNLVERRVDYESLHQRREGFFPLYRA